MQKSPSPRSPQRTRVASVARSLFTGCAALALSAAATLSAPVASAQLSSNFSSSSSSSSKLTPSTPSAPNTTVQRQSVNVPGQGEREYLIEVPASYNSARAYPVIFGFGGWQHDAAQFRGYSNLNEVAGDEAIIVYPEGRAQAWAGARYAQTTIFQDTDFVRTILERVERDYSVDSNRVYGTGLSNGGGMAVAIACKDPQLFSAVTSAAGAYYTPVISDCAWGGVDTLLIHGTNDDHMLYNGGYNDHGGSYFSVPATWRNIGERNGCDTSNAGDYFRSGRSDVFSYRGCGWNGDTVLYKVDGGTHTWFPNDPDAAAVSWEFLRTH